jgi:hypothetical protein
MWIISESQCTERIILKLSLNFSANPAHSQSNNLYIPEGRLGMVIIYSVNIYIYIYIYIYIKIKISFVPQSCSNYSSWKPVRVHTCCMCYILPMFSVYARGAKIFKKSRGHVKILGRRRVTWKKFHAKNPRILVVTVEKFIIEETWHLGFVQTFNIFRTVHLRIILLGNQLDTQFPLNMFIWILYMFREIMCSSSGGQLYEYNFWYNYPLLVAVRCTGRPLTQNDYTRSCIHTIVLLRMST